MSDNANGNDSSTQRRGDDEVVFPAQSSGRPDAAPAGNQHGGPGGSPVSDAPDATVAYDDRRVIRGSDSDSAKASLDRGTLEDASENANTVISQRPVAAPEEFYRSMPLAELAAMLEGRQLDHFSVEQMIGGGGMGAVFRGRDMRLDRVVAIKVIPASKRDPETLRRFRLEAQAAARLDHPNIARVFYVGEAERWNYIVFEFIDGVNMRDLVDMEGPLSIDDAIYYTRQVAEALEHANEREVVHRDIKPSNILVTAAGHAKVVDMGLARDTSMDKSTADETASGVTLGTFDYISPEQARNPRDADVRSDLYSLGCSLFFMLTGNPPFPEGTALQKLLNHGSQPPPDVRLWREDVSDQLHDILMKLMAKRPVERYQRPVELINDLVLLAGYEELPRSQSPGTYMVSPGVSQRTLLETNLPWLVAIAFLLVSTLWLQAIQATSQGRLQNFEAARNTVDRGQNSSPRVEPEQASTDSLPQSVGDAGGQGGADAAAQSALVVSTVQPENVETRRWERTLESALQRAELEPNLDVIEIRGPVILQQPLTVTQSRLHLRGNPLFGNASIEIDPGVFDIAGERAAFILEDATLKISELSLVLAQQGESSLPQDDARVFSMRGRMGVLALDRVTATLAPSQTSQEIAIVDVGSGAPQSVALMQPMVSGRPPVAFQDAPINALPEVWQRGIFDSPSDNRFLVQVDVCELRGDGVMLRYEDGRGTSRMEVVVRNSLVAMRDGTIAAVQSRNGVAGQNAIQMECEESTFVSAAHFAKLDFVGEGTPQLAIHRKSRSCVYFAEADSGHFLVRGATRNSLLGTFQLLKLEGQGNAYSASLAILCEAISGQGRKVEFGFGEASVNGWFAEKGYEFEVLWKKEFMSSIDFQRLSVDDVRVESELMPLGVPRTPFVTQ